MSDPIITAFEQILEELEDTRNALSVKINDYATRGQFDDVVVLGQRGAQLEAFRTQVSQLQDQWRKQFASTTTPQVTPPSKRRNHGLRTPQHVYYQPILQVLVDAGGRARSAFVVSSVYPKVKHLLNSYDHEPLPSNPKETRWANAVAWARNDLREQGLIAPGSPQGIWEISDVGREWLAMHTAVKE